jgi:hypothetical protein
MRPLAILALFFASLFFWESVAQEIALRIWGIETNARIYRTTRTMPGRRLFYTAYYEFSTQAGTLAHGACIGKYDTTGKSLRVLYLPGRPAVNSPASRGYRTASVLLSGIPAWLLILWGSRLLSQRKAPKANPSQEPRPSESLLERTMPRRKPLQSSWSQTFLLSVFSSILLLTLATAFLGLTGKEAKQPREPLGDAPGDDSPVPAPQRGSSVSNEANGSLFGFDGEWVYFNQWRDGGDAKSPPPGLYRCRLKDGSGRALVGRPGETGNIFQGISIRGGWIYYTTMQGLHRIRTEGSGLCELAGFEVQNVSVVGDFVFCLRKDDNRRLWRMTLSGGSQTRLCEEEVGAYSVSDSGWIYYANQTDRGTIYRIRIDGTHRSKFSDRRADMLAAAPGALWLVDSTSKHLLRLSTADRSESSIVEAKVSGFSLQGDALFFSSEGILKRCSLDGANPGTVLRSEDLARFFIHDSFVVFSNWRGDGPVWIARTDGTDLRKIER